MIALTDADAVVQALWKLRLVRRGPGLALRGPGFGGRPAVFLPAGLPSRISRLVGTASSAGRGRKTTRIFPIC
jgi:hypothetical protein